MHEAIFALVSVTALSTVGLVFIAYLWMKKMRGHLYLAVTESAHQQLRNAQHLSQTIAHLEKQHRCYEDQINGLLQANKRLRQEVVALSNRLQPTENGVLPPTSEPTLH